MKKLFAIVCATALPLGLSHAITVKVTVTNNSPGGGVGLAPVWVGFHNGSFDSYDGGAAAAPELETLAEVGDPTPLSNTFAANGTLVSTGVAQTSTRQQANTGVLAPGDSQTLMFDLAGDGSNSLLSYASMILPSNDYFIANGNPLAHDLSSILNSGGTIEFNIGTPGTVNDAGTEVNDFAFSAGNAFGSGLPAGDAPNGAPEGGVVTNVANPFDGFLNAPGGFTPGNLDFNNASIYPNGVATIRVESAGVPEPGAAFPLAALAGTMMWYRRRRR